MTLDQFLSLKPGSVIKRYADGRSRVVCSQPRRFPSGALSGVGLVKVGHSWTGLNRTAWWDSNAILFHYAWTDRVVRLPREVCVWMIRDGKERREAVNEFYGRKVLPAKPRSER